MFLLLLLLLLLLLFIIIIILCGGFFNINVYMLLLLCKNVHPHNFIY